MPPDSPNEQELMLKKRARRRLVGAIALVLLMIIVLPQVLQDRAVIAQQDPIKIVMSGAADIPQAAERSAVSEVAKVNEPPAPEISETQPVLTPETTPQAVTAPSASVSPQKKTDAALVETELPSNSKEIYTVQVGVYSDAANVKRLQDQLKQAGFATRTEKINSAKGVTIRLKAGSYTTRQDAVVALAKIKEIGLPGMVVSQE